MRKTESLSRKNWFAWIPWITLFNSPSDLQQLMKLPSVLVQVGPENCQKGKIFRATIASTIESQTLGLGHRHEPLAPDEAMLFVYSTPQKGTFWMKNTYIPLSIGFFDDRGHLISIHEMDVESDPANPTKQYGPPRPFVAALEANPHSFSKLNLSNIFLCVSDTSIKKRK
jgi:uncharacterized membrane protein (UPF0127 family)